MRVGEQSEWMKLIPILLALGMLAVSGWAESKTIKPYSAELVKRAEAGDATAQYDLGECYHWGKGVTYDEQEAVKWFTKAAEQGNAVAQGYLAACYACGIGVAKDKKKAMKWLAKSAEQGNAGSQYFLGLSYSAGTEVAKDEKEAVKWFTKSANQGNEDAKKELQKLKSK